MRHTRGHTNNRRSHHALKGINVVSDKESGALRLPHRVDETTGMYRGKQIFAPKAPKAVKSAKVKGQSAEAVVAHEHDHSAHEHANAKVKEAEHEKGEVSEAKAETKKAAKASKK